MDAYTKYYAVQQDITPAKIPSSESKSALSDYGQYDIEMVVPEEAEVVLGASPVEFNPPSPRKSSLERRVSAYYAAIHNGDAPATLVWKDLTLSVVRHGKTKVLLNNISGTINGGFWAIMGASGGGKTTLLNALSLRLNSNIIVTGEVTLNGAPYTKSNLKSMAAYVMQDDVLMAELTVVETMEFTAKLRMDRNSTVEQRSARIEELLHLLGIAHVKDVLVGNTVKKGISGGERKRLCIAMELLNKPSLLFLDEPTSGLDSFTSLTVCRALKKLADSGECTVVCTIHQPQQLIFDLFDNLILMKKGLVMYQGNANKIIHFLKKCLGLQIPDKVNTADFLLDMLANEEKLDKGSSERLSSMRDDFTKLQVDLSAGSDRPAFPVREEQNWFWQFAVILGRNMKQTLRNWHLTVMTVVMSAVLALFVAGGSWQNLGDKKGQQYIGRWPSSIFFCCLTQGIAACLQSLHQFPSERALSMREREAGTYRVSAYFMAKNISDLSVQLLGPIVFTIIAYPMIGYQAKADKFFLFMWFMMLDTACATGLASMISCFCVNLNLTTVVLSLGMEICRVYGGFFMSPKLMSDFPAWRWADVLSYLKYCFLGTVISQLEGLEFKCTQAEISSNTCIITEGEQLMAERGYDKYTVGGCIGAAIAFLIGYRIFAYLALRYVKT